MHNKRTDISAFMEQFTVGPYFNITTRYTEFRISCVTKAIGV